MVGIKKNKKNGGKGKCLFVWSSSVIDEVNFPPYVAACAISWLQYYVWVDLQQQFLVTIHITTIVPISFQNLIMPAYFLKAIVDSFVVSLGIWITAFQCF